MSANGRPIRFLAVVLGGWTAVRIAVLWPSIETPADMIDAVVASASRRTISTVTAPAVPIAARTGAAPRALMRPAISVTASIPAAPAPDPRRIALATLGLMHFSEAEPVRRAAPAAPIASLPLAPRPMSAISRWSGSGWLVVRGEGSAGSAFGGGQLGGSQVGLRLAYTIDRSHRIAIAGRVSAPLSGKGREAAIGVAWQPTSAPVRIVAEQRVSLDGGDGGPALGVIGGVGPVAVTPDITVEVYAQAGAIARDGIEAFADGAARIARPMADLGETMVDLGVGAWGAAQRDAARLDIGPSLSADVPIGRGAHLRVAVDWRARIAGDARPGSGLVLSLGTDF